MKTELSDRILWYDGTNEVDAKLVPFLILQGVKPGQIIASSMNDDLSLFNMINDEQISSVKETLNLDLSWNIPDEYLNIDIQEYCYTKLDEFYHGGLLSQHHNIEDYISRINDEILFINEKNLFALFRCLIYIVDTLKSTNSFWGVGRGSSCASLILFLIGIHLVDPIKYDIPANEFFHD